MAKAGRKLASGLAITLCIVRPVAAEPPSVTLRVHNTARVAPETLQAAQTVATEVFEAIGVQLVWREGGASAPPSSAMTLDIVLTSRRQANEDVLGAALLNSARIYVFYDRVKQLARTRQLPSGTILGRVLAHEVGHHVLPGQGHSQWGIMRDTVDDQWPIAPEFTIGQADAIRTLFIRR